jgi:hypothetical protein
MAFAFYHGDLPDRHAITLTDMGDAGSGPRQSPWSRFFTRNTPMPTSSPWGAIIDAKEISPGILWFSTAARSGYRLSAKRQRALPRSLRTEDGWYEDGSEWAAVAVVFHRIFDQMPAGADMDDLSLYDVAKETLRNWRPEEYESWFQTTIDEADFGALAITQFHQLHADRWIALEVFDDREPFVADGCLHVRARMGGDPPYSAGSGRSLGPSRWFVIDADEFTRGRGKAFVIDTERHHEIDEPVCVAAVAG